MPDFSPHLHTETCNKYIKQLFDCMKNHPVKKYFGVCNHENALMERCLYLEREQNREENRKKAEEKRRKIYQLNKRSKEKSTVAS